MICRGRKSRDKDKREDLHSIFVSLCHSICVSLISQDTCLKAGKCVRAWGGGARCLNDRAVLTE